MPKKASNPDDERTITITELPLVALRETVIFPEMIVPLQVGRDKSVAALNAAVAEGGRIALVTQRQADQEDITDPAQLYVVGTVAKIAQVVQLQDGTVRAIIQGQGRMRLHGFAQTEPFIRARVEELTEGPSTDVEVQALMRSVQAQVEQYVQVGAPVPPEAAVAARNITEPGLLADMTAYSPDMTTEQRQELLETIDVAERLKIASAFLAHQIEVHELKGRIQSEVKSEMDKTQREYILREQMKAIQRELNEEDPQQADVNELREKVEAAGMPDEVKARALKEVDRMSRIPSASPEVGVIRTYVDWLVSLPWNVTTDDLHDIKEAARILDEDHFGLEKVKERILEYLAVRVLADTIRSPILALVGPPGVGKTSLGKSIARAMGRKFVRMSLGGIHDEAEIRGHRRTYIGALPGRIIQNVKTAGTNNPVFMLDEIDKVGMDFRGDPSSALLEVLDPEQNNSFQDNYLEVPFDLSKVLFVATGNLVDPIPMALRDRMEIIQVPGYTQREKVEIGKRFLIPKQMENHGLKAKHVAFSDEAMTELVQAYTHEAGVRNLEREIANVMRKVARTVAEGRKAKTTIDKKKLLEYLGPPRFEYGELEPEDQIGSATGLVVTEVGGDVVAIEVTQMEGKEDFILTGQLGEVMRESARAGLSWIRSHASELGIPRETFEKQTLHIHVPAGGIPKDGPSAGITMATAMVSAFTGIPVRKDLAMTGEITLRGRVLPIGGLKSKMLAAHLAGAKVVMFPKKNEKDLRDIPEEIRKTLKLVAVESMDQVLEVALRRRPKPLPVAPKTPVRDTQPDKEPETETPMRRPNFPPDQPTVVVKGLKTMAEGARRRGHEVRALARSPRAEATLR
ncbi:MAG TPA: endopeptidase La [Candidatus Limnocylindria bacterium]|nr:endopeptidase La [Candidatus Limnocylindria bacterium]